jgi:hypothetical protein
MTDTNTNPSTSNKNKAKNQAKKNDKPAEAEADPNAKPAEGTEKSKRTIIRRPLWVCIPASYEMNEIEVDEGETKVTKIVQVPKTWTIARVMSKKAVLAELTARGVDTTNIDQVRLFRANPIDFKISNQLVVKF